MQISSLKICTVWTSDSKSLWILEHNFESSLKRRWFIIFLLFEKWYALSGLSNIIHNEISKSLHIRSAPRALLSSCLRLFFTCPLTSTIPRHYRFQEWGTISHVFLKSFHTTARFFLFARTSESTILSINNRSFVPFQLYPHAFCFSGNNIFLSR